MIKMKHYLSVFVGASLALFGHQTLADQKIQDDLIVVGSLCVGLDCVNGESFNFDTIRMKENNVRIRFIDSSNSSSFPTVDWQLTANESTNGGLNMFSIENIDRSTIPFTIIDGAPTGSIFVRDNGWVGLGTTAPIMQLHVVDSNTPTLRLEQDQGAGFAAQAWDVGGNESNFFVRDVTNGGVLPLRIQTNAINASLYIGTSGKIGFGSTTPDGLFDVAHPANANNHALLLSTVGDFGVNIDNGFNPRGLFDIQTTGGYSRFLVNSSGNVGVGTGTSSTINGRFDLRSLDGSQSYFNVDASGGIGIGTSAPVGRFEIKDLANTLTYLDVNADGRVGFGVNTFVSEDGIIPLVGLQNKVNEHNSIYFNSTAPGLTSSLSFAKQGHSKWIFSSRNDWNSGADSFLFFDENYLPVLSLFQGGKIGLGVASVASGNAIEHLNGAVLTIGGVWTNASSRSLKNDIIDITVEAAQGALSALKPVTFTYKKEPDEVYAGFIAEDVPEIVATNDRRHLAAMDITAILTKVVQAQQKTIEQLNARLDKIEASSEK